MQKFNIQKKAFLIFSFFVILLLANILQSANAMLVDDLYITELKATDKTATERKGLFLKGFDQILLKLTDESNIYIEPRIKAAKEQIDKYVSSFSYKDNPGADLQVKIIFNEAMINTLLKAASKPYLSKNRPIILVWLVLDTANGFQLIGEDEHALFVTKLEQIAARHAIPLILPLLDLEERTKIKVDDVIAGTPIVLEEAAIKYNADVVLVGKITNFAGFYKGKWNILGNTPSAWETQGKTIDEQYSQLMQALKENLINRYATNTQVNIKEMEAATNVVRIKVAGVNSLENYAKILVYLRGLASVNLVEVVDIATDGATFELHVDGGENAVKKAINLDRFLEQSTLDESLDKDLHELHYRVCS